MKPWKPSRIRPSPRDGRVHFRLQHMWNYVRRVWAPANGYESNPYLVVGVAPL
jgi:hypothetical protein